MRTRVRVGDKVCFDDKTLTSDYITVGKEYEVEMAWNKGKSACITDDMNSPIHIRIQGSHWLNEGDWTVIPRSRFYWFSKIFNYVKK